MCRLQQTIEPDAKLKKMIDLLKIVLTINIIIIISHTIISFQKSDSGTSVFMEIISLRREPALQGKRDWRIRL